MFWTAIVFFAGMALVHIVGALWFRAWSGREAQQQTRRAAPASSVSTSPEEPDEEADEEARLRSESALGKVSEPRVAVLLSTRGWDPFFESTLRGLTTQDYRNFEVHVVVDGAVDAVDRARRALADGGLEFQLYPLQAPRPDCGLKCSAWLQLLPHLPNNLEILAFLDSDVVPHPSWLTTLVAGLEDPAVGMVTGGQWFEMPRSGTCLGERAGSWVRALWNAGSIVPTSLFGNPWAGTMAMRRRDFELAGLPEIWSHSVVDDGPIRRAMHAIGLRVQVEPRLLMINRETCGLGFAVSYIARLLTWARWFEPTFWNTAVHALLMSLAWFCIIFAYVKALLEGMPGNVLALSLVLVGGLWGYVLAFAIVRNAVLRVTDHQGPPRSRFGPGAWLTAFLIMPITHGAFFMGVIRAILFRRVKWRGIEYFLHRRDKIEMQGYVPPTDEKRSESHSL